VPGSAHVGQKYSSQYPAAEIAEHDGAAPPVAALAAASSSPQTNVTVGTAVSVGATVGAALDTSSVATVGAGVASVAVVVQ
jgi:hypothetical protein